jgi:hypothetical protein
MKTYKLTIANAENIVISLIGVKPNSNPFQPLGEITFEKRNGVFYIIQSDFPKYYPVSQYSHQYWNCMPDIFDNTLNNKIETLDYEKSLCFLEYQTPVYSKHKINTTTWKLIIYNPSDPILKKSIAEWWKELRAPKSYQINI